MNFLKKNWFPVLMTLIAAVSLYDTALIVKFSDTIHGMEENPIGVWLLSIGDGSIWLFVRAKVAGTLTVLSVLTLMYRCRSNKTLPVTSSIAAYQTGLFTYLTFA